MSKKNLENAFNLNYLRHQNSKIIMLFKQLLYKKLLKRIKKYSVLMKMHIISDYLVYIFLLKLSFINSIQNNYTKV